MKNLFVIFALMIMPLCVAAACPAAVSGCMEGVFGQDSISYHRRKPYKEQPVRARMSHSAYPVVLHVVGNVVRVDSPERQILPIYTQNGSFYMIMRLNKGTNWLSGLPKGSYFINSRLITIK